MFLAVLPSLEAGAEGILRSERAVRKSQMIFPDISTQSECEKKAAPALARTKKALQKLGPEAKYFRTNVAYERSRETGLLQCALNFESFSAKYVLVEMDSTSEYANRGENCSSISQYFSKNPWVFHFALRTGLTSQVGGDCSVQGVRVGLNPESAGEAKAHN